MKPSRSGQARLTFYPLPPGFGKQRATVAVLPLPGAALRPGSLDLVVGGGKVVERQRDRDGFLRKVLEHDLELFPRPERVQRFRRDRKTCVTAAVLAGLNRQIDALAVIDLKLRASLQI